VSYVSHGFQGINSSAIKTDSRKQKQLISQQSTLLYFSNSTINVFEL